VSLASFHQSLQKILGPDRISLTPTNRLLYSHDAMSGLKLESKAGHPRPLPDMIVWPETVHEISQIVKLANREKVPMVPYGAGSGVSGGTVPVRGGVILDLKRMNRLEKITSKNGLFYVTAETGILGEHLEQTLQSQGFTLGHFPSSILCATLGGYLACRSAGQLSSKYGKIEDMTDDIEVVLPNGDLLPFGRTVKNFPKVRPRDLFVGSEGCLGIITKARLKVFPLPIQTRYRGVSFPRLELALQAIRETMQTGLRPSVVRLYDPFDSLILKQGYRGSKIPIPRRFISKKLYPLLFLNPSWTERIIKLVSSEVLLILGFEGSPEIASAQEKKMLEICRRSQGRDLGEGPGLHWLKHRYSVSFKMPQIFEENGFVDTIEVATTWDRLLKLYEGVKKVLTQDTLLLAHFSHAYPEGCSIYFTVIGRCRSPEEDTRRYAKLWHDAMETCLKMGATISHHHGIGLLKAKYLPRELGPAMDFFREIKKKLDPQNIMNPGKMGL